MAFQHGVLIFAAAIFALTVAPSLAAPPSVAPPAGKPAPAPPPPVSSRSSTSTRDAQIPSEPVVSPDAAARARMHECGHQWSALKKAGTTGTLTWKQFSATCLVVSK